MDLRERIQQDLNLAIKGKKELEVLVLRQLSAAILNKEKEKRYKLSKEKPETSESFLIEASRLTDEETIDVIVSEAKKRREAIEGFLKGDRQESADKENKELEILAKYLPEQISEEDLKKMIKEAVERVGAKEVKDMGKVMAELMPKIKGKADSSLVGKMVKDVILSL